MEHLSIESWVSRSRRLKWQWASKVALMPRCRWTALATRWEPQITSTRARRSVGHPRKRWSDEIVQAVREHCGSDAD
eukprot:9507545-Karenia_brevis.AAC.1